LIQQDRTQARNCISANAVQTQQSLDLCYYKKSKEPFGIDPVFLSTSTLYNDAIAGLVRNYYPNETTKLLNSKGLPYGFFVDQTSGLGSAPDYKDDFPIYFDIDFSQQKALQMLQYIRDGFYLDKQTKVLSVRMLTYNPMFDMYTYIRIEWKFQDGGLIRMRYQIQSIDIYKYGTGTSHQAFDNGNDGMNHFRTVLEVFLWLFALYYFAVELQEMYTLGLKLYFESIWNWLDLANFWVQLGAQVIWLHNSLVLLPNYKHTARWDVHPNPSRPARMMELNQTFAKVLSAFDTFGDAISNIDFFILLNSVSVLLMILRVLKILHFQPRMGLVTRTIQRAFVDLAHFTFLFFFVTTGYAIVGHLTFGSEIYEFSNVGLAFETCMHFLLGELHVKDDLDHLSNKGTVSLFFWSFILIVFFILINVLLAIIVDAYVEVKESATGSSTMLQDVWEIFCTDFSFAVNSFQRVTRFHHQYFVHPTTMLNCARQMQSLHLLHLKETAKSRIPGRKSGSTRDLIPVQRVHSRFHNEKYQVRVGGANMNLCAMLVLLEFARQLEVEVCAGKDQVQGQREESSISSWLFCASKDGDQVSSRKQPNILNNTGSYHLAIAILSLFEVHRSVEEHLGDSDFKNHMIKAVHRMQKELEANQQAQISLQRQMVHLQGTVDGLTNQKVSSCTTELSRTQSHKLERGNTGISGILKRGTKPGTITIG